MELVLVIATITSFFSHLMIEKSIVANTVSVVVASLITWMLVGDLAAEFDTTYMRNIFITVMIALVTSMIAGYAPSTDAIRPAIDRLIFSV